MGASTEQFAQELMSGRRRGVKASLLRGVLGAAEAPYALLMRARNGLYHRGWLRSHRLKVPVISVGNITAGGTGKTPMVRWLVERLRGRGMNPAVLMRGYRRSASGMSDEQGVLAEALSEPQRPAIVHANPDRISGGHAILRDHPAVDSIVLDDGFQHRRLARDVDLVLIDATLPFGYEHVHPRGLLREPLGGLRRADAFVLTRSDLAGEAECKRIAAILRTHNPFAPVYYARHELVGLKSAEADLPLSTLAGQRFLAAAGIANPTGFERQLHALPGTVAGFIPFPDHHDYAPDDLEELRRKAGDAGAGLILVTEKDWVKIRRLPNATGGAVPMMRVDLRITLDGEEGLLSLIEARIEAQRDARGQAERASPAAEA